MLRPGGDAGEVVGERVPVVGRDGEREDELVGEERDDEHEEGRRDRIAHDLGQRRRAPAPSGRPGRPRAHHSPSAATSRIPSATASPAAGDLAQRRQRERDEPELGDEREVGDEQRRDEARKARARGEQERDRDGGSDQRDAGHGPRVSQATGTTATPS